jgi:broad specificity phosphatase PhoE
VGWKEERSVLSLYLLRHGETEYSRQERFCGHLDARLTPDGHRMAAAFADAYGDLPWCEVLTSTRARTLETALPLTTRMGLSITPDRRLDEMSFGRWQGLSKAEADARDPEHFARWRRDPAVGPPGGETPAAVAARALAALGDLEQRHDRGPVLVVSHKTVLRILLCHFVGAEIGRYRELWSCPVGSLSVVDLGADGASLRVVDDVSHLPESLRPALPADERGLAATNAGDDGVAAAV